jgi:ATP-dependent DNA helicase RecG
MPLQQRNPTAPSKPAPATRPPSKKTAEKAPAKPRAPKDPLKQLKLTDGRLALLCAPASYVDCREARTRIAISDVNGVSALYRLRFTGTMKGYFKNAAIWETPSAQFLAFADLPNFQKRRTTRTVLEVVDDNGCTAFLSTFTGPFQWADIKAGDELVVVGSLLQFRSGFYINVDARPPMHALNGIWTSYRGIAGQISGERVEMLVAASMLDESSPRACAAHIMGETGMREDNLLSASAAADGTRFDSITALLSALHRPTTVAQGQMALDCAKRISALAVQAAALRHHSRPAHPTAPLALDPSQVSKLASLLPMPLTASQREVAQTVVNRMTEPVPLTALLSGDVGTGKTLAFLLPAVVAHLAGARVAIITPRQLLADQIASEILTKFGSVVTKLECIEAGGRIMDPSSILVGTAGLVTTAAAQGYVPQLLICDEQHKLATSVREGLVGAGTHLLEVSATPVPRSLAASLYDGMQILNLRECPVQKEIRSHVMDMGSRGQVIAALRQTLARGERAAMVYPRVSSDADDANSVTNAFKSLDSAFPGQCVMLHGQMGDDEIRSNLDQFRKGQRRLVIASTVLEIGIDVPSIGLMVVRGADSFGISQLHQLRGRLARNGGAGEFIMVVDDLTTLPPATKQRLEAVQRTTDGYELAEIDLLQRGFGEVDGEAQTGLSKTLFRLVKLGVADFMARKLRTLATPAAGGRKYAQSGQLSERHVQERLI